ncbi:MAG: hypothetical protein DRJ51_02525 [Thermoprotei archaeon]|nr:MAG: hypothetical protein DRJ51_02525 [Thermoprotei archaeon]RLF02988.1 MAG: hypothetical protein DRJ59_02035 [Thermoprotei archaeon]
MFLPYRYRVLLRELERKIESGEYESLRSVITEIEEEALAFFEKRISMAGLNAKRPLKSLLLGLFIYSLLEDLGYVRRLSPERLAVDFYEIVSRIGDMDVDIGAFKEDDIIEASLYASRIFSTCDETLVRRAVESIKLLAAFLEKTKVSDESSPLDIGRKFVLFMLKDAARALSLDLYEPKAPLFGYMLVLSRSGFSQNALESLRISLMSLPSGSQRIANNILLYLVYVLRVWRDHISFLHVPIDPPLSYLIDRLGLIRPLTLRRSVDYFDYKYVFLQKIAAKLFPSRPIMFALLKYLTFKYCKRRRPYCEECPLSFNCERYLT